MKDKSYKKRKILGDQKAKEDPSSLEEGLQGVVHIVTRQPPAEAGMPKF